MGGSLNAYTSHDLVAFHITVRAESAMEAIDLLTDFVGRPKIDPAELDKERGVVIQEIQRYKDQPAAVAEELIDRAHFGDHPLGRTVLGPEDHLRTFSRDAIVAFRERRWSGARGGRVRRRQRRPRARPTARSTSSSRASPICPRPSLRAGAAFEPRSLVEERDSNQSHLRMSYRPEVAVDDPKARAAFTIYSTLLGGSMGSRLFDEIREQRGLATRSTPPTTPTPTSRCCSSGSGLESSKCAEAYTRMREIVGELAADGPTPEEVERRRAYAAGRRVLAFENTNAVARYAANQRIVFDEDIDPMPPSPCSTRSPSTRSPRRPGPSTRQARGRVRRPARRAASSHLVKPLARRLRVGQNALVPVAEALNERELSRYVSRVSDRWPLTLAMLGGARADDALGAAPQRERGPEYVVLLVSERFDGVPWLERVYQCGACGTRPRWATTPTCTATRRSSSSASARACRSCAG
jgi:hypothetical protein